MNTELKNAITLMINEEIVKAKEIIEKDLYARLGQALEEKLMEFAPTVFNEEKEKDEEDEKDDSEDSEDEGDEGDEEDDEESDDEDEKEMNERFEYELYEAITNLVEELQEEEGRLLSQEEIEMVAEEFINQYQLISEESEELDPVGEEDGDIDNDGDEDDSDGYLAARRSAIAQAMRGE
jgi:hypothetical protein